MSGGSPMPIFTRTCDLLTWLVPVSNHFPRAHRFTVTQRKPLPSPAVGDSPAAPPALIGAGRGQEWASREAQGPFEGPSPTRGARP